MSGGATHLELTGVGPTARAAWGEILPQDPDALPSQTPQWMDSLCSTGPYEDVTRTYATLDGHRLVLPLARRRLPGIPMIALSMPSGWGTGGVVSSRGKISEADVAAVIHDIVSESSLFIGLRPNPLTAERWHAAVPTRAVLTRHMTQSINLSGGFDAVWKHGFASTIRSACRKAERRGVTVERDDTGKLMPVFDALYRQSVDRWARQQHEPLWLARWRGLRRDPPEKFKSVASLLGPACRTWVASRGGEPIAATIVLTQGRHSYMWRAAMNKEATRGTGANELMHALSVEEACEAGHRFFHLGESTPSSALAENKKRFGCEELHYTGYRFERLPLTAADRLLRAQIKRVIGFRD